jgi:hypothetical protein
MSGSNGNGGGEGGDDSDGSGDERGCGSGSRGGRGYRLEITCITAEPRFLIGIEQLSPTVPALLKVI